MNENGKNNSPLIIVAVILALGLVLSAYVAGSSLVKAKEAANSISITGSAKKQIKSDLAVWKGSFSASAPEMTAAYARLQESQDKVRKYLQDKGIANKDIVFSSISTNTRYVMLPNGQTSNQVESYELYQTVEIKSKNVDQITLLSREATDLINQGIEFQSMPPEYFYTKIADLKIEMLSLATKDAMKRAEQIALNTNSRVGALRSARMGVFQITPLYSNEVSDYGINDTSSLDKEITAVMTCEFQIIK
ncbi:MAG: SIMPL domain-containing protein [Deltaproteobacteria bacterium]